jgi:hypothetical protein
MEEKKQTIGDNNSKTSKKIWERSNTYHLGAHLSKPSKTMYSTATATTTSQKPFPKTEKEKKLGYLPPVSKENCRAKSNF